MSTRRLVITAVLAGRSQSEVARDYGVSQGWVSRLLARYRLEGDAAFQPRSRRPKTSPTVTSTATVDLIVALRRQLTDVGLDAGPDTIVWHLAHHHGVTVSAATVARHLTAQGLVIAQPQKRPKSSLIRVGVSDRLCKGVVLIRVLPLWGGLEKGHADAQADDRSRRVRCAGGAAA